MSDMYERRQFGTASGVVVDSSSIHDTHERKIVGGVRCVKETGATSRLTMLLPKAVSPSPPSTRQCLQAIDAALRELRRYLLLRRPRAQQERDRQVGDAALSLLHELRACSTRQVPFCGLARLPPSDAV